jgi:Fe(II)/alpha-ketoglutarate-dependent arginine beta-hydroxylase
MRVALTSEDKIRIGALLDELATRHPSAESPEFLAEAPVLSHELPLAVRRALVEFRLKELSPFCIISGYPLDDARIGPTPIHWKDRQRHVVPLREEMLLVLFSFLLGDPIAWATQQDGALVHDIAPIAGHEKEQLGSSSAEELTWHTEDAFHPFRGDYLGMMCMRNLERVPTTLAAVDLAELDASTRQVLFQPHFTIRPDNSHLRKNRCDAAPIQLEAAHDRIEEMKARPEKIPVLFGSPDAPYCRLDPYFMDEPEDPEAREALNRLVALINRRLQNVTLEAGDVCFIDNFRAVHGRRPFKARFDGTDRWLKRVNITRDLRRSRACRGAADSRLLL